MGQPRRWGVALTLLTCLVIFWQYATLITYIQTNNVRWSDLERVTFQELSNVAAEIACPQCVPPPVPNCRDIIRDTPIYDMLPIDFRFHVYKVPPHLFEDIERLSNPQNLSVHPALDPLKDVTQSNVPYLMAKYLPLHPRHTDDPEKAHLFIIPHVTSLVRLIPEEDRPEWLMEEPDSYRRALIRYLHGQPTLKRRLGYDHFVFSFHLNQMDLQGIASLSQISLEHDQMNVLGANFPDRSRRIMVPFLELSPHLLERNRLLQQGKLDLARESERRTIFAYFLGTITERSGLLRVRMRDTLQAHNDTCIYRGLRNRHSTDKYDTIYQEMERAIFCPTPPGDSSGSRRLFTALLSGCIPVIMSDFLVLPYTALVDWSRISVRLSSNQVFNEDFVELLQTIPKERIHDMQREIARVSHRFIYNEGKPQRGDALDSLVEVMSMRAAVLEEYSAWLSFNRRVNFQKLGSSDWWHNASGDATALGGGALPS